MVLETLLSWLTYAACVGIDVYVAARMWAITTVANRLIWLTQFPWLVHAVVWWTGGPRAVTSDGKDFTLPIMWYYKTDWHKTPATLYRFVVGDTRGPTVQIMFKAGGRQYVVYVNCAKNDIKRVDLDSLRNYVDNMSSAS